MLKFKNFVIIELEVLYRVHFAKLDQILHLAQLAKLILTTNTFFIQRNYQGKFFLNHNYSQV